MDTPSQPTKTEDRGPHSFPLGAMFLLMAAVAAVTAQLALFRGVDTSSIDVVGPTILTSISGAVFGVTVGLHDYRRVLGGITGFFVGLLVGALAGPISVAAENQPLPAITTAGCSAIGLVLFSWLYRISNTRE